MLRGSALAFCPKMSNGTCQRKPELAQEGLCLKKVGLEEIGRALGCSQQLAACVQLW